MLSYEVTLTTTSPPSSCRHTSVFRKRPPPALLKCQLAKHSSQTILAPQTCASTSVAFRMVVKLIWETHPGCPSTPPLALLQDAPLAASAAAQAGFPWLLQLVVTTTVVVMAMPSPAHQEAHAQTAYSKRSYSITVTTARCKLESKALRIMPALAPKPCPTLCKQHVPHVQPPQSASRSVSYF